MLDSIQNVPLQVNKTQLKISNQDFSLTLSIDGILIIPLHFRQLIT